MILVAKILTQIFFFAHSFGFHCLTNFAKKKKKKEKKEKEKEKKYQFVVDGFSLM